MSSYAMFIPPKAKTVLEFGCGSGDTGQEFKRIQPRCRYIGVDDSEINIRSAAAVLDQAILQVGLNINPSHYGLTKGNVGCIVYHGRYLTDDWPKQFQNLSELLSKDGQMLLVIENAGYFPNIMSMLKGRAPLLSHPLPLDLYLEQIKQAGFYIDNVVSLYKGSDINLQKDANVAGMLKSFTEHCEAQGVNVRTNIWAAQFVVRITCREFAPKLMIHSVIGEQRVTARVRVHDPYTFVGTMPGVVHVEQNLIADLSQSVKYPQKVLLQHRMQPAGIKEMKQNMQKLRERGYLVVGEIDDSPDFWRESYEKTKYIAFSGCHAMQVSTEPLREEIARYNPHVVVFPNHLKELPPPKDFSRVPPDAPINIFFGALNREKDWEPIMPVINQVLKDYDGKIKFTVMFDKQFFARLETKHKEMIGQEYPDGYAPYKVYADTLHKADISLLPLVDSERSRMKSDLKFIESGAHTAAVLASSVVYNSSVRDGGTGLIYHNIDEFAAKLRILLDNHELRCQLAESAYDYVRRHRLLADHYDERVSAYKELLDRWQELDDDLTKRLAMV